MAWYPGEEGAAALADIVTGAAEPTGRLPISFPKRIEDTAPHGDGYPGANGKVSYSEGVLVGYRHHDTNEVEPAFGFGHGLGYTQFELGEPTVTGEGTDLTVSMPVTNTGDRPGTTVVQLYVHDVEAKVARPAKELKGFAKPTLDAGETRTVQIQLDDRSFAYWDDGWVVEPGEFDLLVGTSSRAVASTTRIVLGG
jgi:beta-glucosidase